ncbi:(deoxy)nucleoside triphosphate pyrophosphohydrolase [Bacillus kexueae]|uniref:(deoxy)nucleoside triphosphate pyrophosphohydrolase n=1 Tax=Aeribacillus kexueae TaxID=2078952 RepID=UPI001FAFBA8B|nr:(deoxy)nucleoside triphosphate pyrophosphohydrolase [Bacillus kexueae]
MKKTIQVVAAVIFNHKNEVLCALRSSKMSLPNLWEFPGGKIEQGENPKEALVREIREELGCTVKVYEKIKEVHHEYENFIVNLLTYKTTIIQDTPIAKEHAELKWVPTHKLNTLKWAPADVGTVETLINKTIRLNQEK